MIDGGIGTSLAIFIIFLYFVKFYEKLQKM